MKSPTWLTFYKRRPFFAVRLILFRTVAKQGLPINIKKGQFLAPWDMRHVVNKARAVGNECIMVV